MPIYQIPKKLEDVHERTRLKNRPSLELREIAQALRVIIWRITAGGRASSKV